MLNPGDYLPALVHVDEAQGHMQRDEQTARKTLPQDRRTLQRYFRPLLHAHDEPGLALVFTRWATGRRRPD